jgi:ABC-type transport system substrate-binding protein
MVGQPIRLFAVLLLMAGLVLAVACGGETVTVIETVIVTEKGDTVVVTEKGDTVVVTEKGDTVIETVIVTEKGDTVIVTEKGDTVIQTVIVDRIVVATATTKSAATSEAPEFSGAAVVAGRVEAQIFRVALSGQGFADALRTRYGVFEGLLRADTVPGLGWGDIGSEGIADSWIIAPDQSKVTFHIREGVEFHNGWGEVTAEDVAFSFNDSLSEESVFTRAGRLGVWIDHVEVVDENTIDMHLLFLEPTWNIRLSNSGDTTVPIVSKTAFDQLGSDEFNVTDMGTGPFTVRSWRVGDEIMMDRFADYFRVDARAKVASLRYVSIPEPAVQLAALETGQIDIATGKSSGVQLNLVNNAVERSGGTVINLGLSGTHPIMFAGNYWAETWPDTGEAIERRPGFTPDADHPWIGDPFGDGNDMESARLVRWAMAHAIDRQLLVDAFLEGLGSTRYTEIKTSQGDAVWKDEWYIRYDPDTARKYLADAGYPDGFDVTLWESDVQIDDAIAQMWTEIGLNVTLDTTVYDALRPKFVDKTMNFPYPHGGKQPRTVDGSYGELLVPTRGTSRSVELPDDIAALYFENLQELGGPEYLAERLANNVALQDYLTHWMIMAPTVSTPGKLYIINKGVEWHPHQADFAFFNSPETIDVSGK